MKTPNALAALLNCAAKAFAGHESKIGDDASDALLAAATAQVIKSSHTVAQCNALQQVHRQHSSALNNEIAQAENLLHWNDTGATVKDSEIQKNLAFTELLGPTGMIFNQQCRVGLFLQNQHANYPNHKHAAEELYLVISGQALWSKSDLKPTRRMPGEFIHHSSWEPHSMQTSNEPMLAIWYWAGDIDYGQYKMI